MQSSAARNLRLQKIAQECLEPYTLLEKQYRQLQEPAPVPKGMTANSLQSRRRARTRSTPPWSAAARGWSRPRS